MATASTSTVVDQSTDAAFRTWVQEIITMMFTTLTVTQTADTGQINTTTVVRAGANTAAGYVIGRFNDAAQATSPIFFKLEFGSGLSNLVPFMWITVGTASNGTGTITGTVMSRVALSPSTTIVSTITPYITRMCYNTTAGVLWMNWKQAASGANNMSQAGFAIYRSADSTGAVTTDAVMLLANSSSASGTTNSGGAVLALSYLTNLAYNNGGAYSASNNFCIMPFSASVTLFSGNSQVGPVFQYTPVLGITPWVAVAVVSEFPINTTQVMTLVGAGSHTYIGVQGFAGLASFTNVNNSGYSAVTYTLALLWE